MSKRSRLERREGQVRRAVADPAANGAHRPSRLRLEQALAAFALGDDAKSARVAASDPEVRAVVGCLLDAARAAPPDAIPASTPEPLRSLHAVASAISAAARGEHALARRWLKRVAPGQREALLTRELGAAIDLSARPRGKDVSALAEKLVTSPHVRTNVGVVGALVAELGEVDPERAIDAGEDLGLSVDSMREVILKSLAGKRAATETGEVGVSLELVRRLEPDVFDDTTRGAAFIYEGFAWMEEDPQRAATAFDRAIECGGDLVEALRGKLLLALSRDGVCEECGVRHGNEESGDDDAAMAADRLARVLGRTAAAAPLASVAAMVAAEEWVSIGDTKAARASITLARKSAPESMAPAIDLLEARALESADPARAADLLAALLARDPGNREAWRMSISIATRRGDRRRADDLIVQAADSTRDPELIARARDVRIARGEIAPFEGFVPGVTTAGELAAEIQRASAVGVAGEHPAGAALPPSPLAPIVQRCRDALAPPARLAFDAARIIVAARAHGGQAARARFAEVASEWRSSSADVTRLGAIMLLMDDGAALVEWAVSLGGHDDAGPALVGLIEAAIAAVEIPIAKRLLALANKRLPRKEVFRAKALIARVERGGFAGSVFGYRPEAVAHELNGLLAPHFRIPHDEDEDLDDDLDDEGPFGDMRPASLVLAAFFETLDLPVEALDSLPPMRRAEFEAEAMELIVTGRPGPAASKKIRMLVDRVVKEIGPWPFGSRAGAGRASGGGKR